MKRTMTGMAVAQTAPPTNSGSFSLNAQEVALPGGGQTVAATDVGFTKQVTTNFSLGDDNILAPSNGMRLYGAAETTFCRLASCRKQS